MYKDRGRGVKTNKFGEGMGKHFNIITSSRQRVELLLSKNGGGKPLNKNYYYKQ